MFKYIQNNYTKFNCCRNLIYITRIASSCFPYHCQQVFFTAAIGTQKPFWVYKCSGSQPLMCDAPPHSPYFFKKCILLQYFFKHCIAFTKVIIHLLHLTISTVFYSFLLAILKMHPLFSFVSSIHILLLATFIDSFLLACFF